MDKIRLKLDNHIKGLLEIIKVMLDLDDTTTSQILNKLTKCLDVNPLTSYEVEKIRITNKKADIIFHVYTQGEILLKTTINLKVNKNKDDILTHVDCEDKILWNLFTQTLEKEKEEN